MGKQNKKIKNIIESNFKSRIVVKIILAIIFISAVLLVSCKAAQSDTIDSAAESNTGNSVNVYISGDIQTIEVTANGGYFPEELNAKAGIESVLIIKSDNAYGCERAFRIPALGVNETLPINGITEVELGTQEKGTTILGTCSMGMYTFEIIFN